MSGYLWTQLGGDGRVKDPLNNHYPKAEYMEKEMEKTPQPPLAPKVSIYAQRDGN